MISATGRARIARVVGALGVAASLGAVLSGCGARTPAGSADDRPAVESGVASGGPGVAGFPAGAPADYQLGGGYPPPAGVRIVVRDSAEQPAPGTYGVCYVNAFQTQPQLAAEWLADRPDLVLRDPSGTPVIDPDWPDEYLLDTATPEHRDRIAAVVGETVRRCAQAGYAAVEFDNLDSASRSNGALTDDGNLALAAALVRTAHDAGLAAGQKNAADLGARGRAEAGFDFAVAEECVAFGECGAYTAVYGDRVIGVEYTDNLSGDPCADPARPRTTVVRDRALVRVGAPGYVYRQC